MNLCEARFRENYYIINILAEEPIKSRLNAMGFYVGSKISVLDFTLHKQTYKVIVEDTKIAIRKEEANSIWIGDIYAENKSYTCWTT
jgi:Fe2+ transport system protein A